MDAINQFIRDIGWALLMFRIRRHRRGLVFSARKRFDDLLRHPISVAALVTYPDAIYHITADDFVRAKNRYDYNADMCIQYSRREK